MLRRRRRFESPHWGDASITQAHTWSRNFLLVRHTFSLRNIFERLSVEESRQLTSRLFRLSSRDEIALPAIYRSQEQSPGAIATFGMILRATIAIRSRAAQVRLGGFSINRERRAAVRSVVKYC